MTSLLLYLLKANVLLIICIAMYHLLLKNLSFHQWKRAYLVFCMCIVAVGPAFVWRHYTTVNIPVRNDNITNTSQTIKQANTLSYDLYLKYLYLFLLLVIAFGIIKSSIKLYKSYQSLAKIQKQATLIHNTLPIYHHPKIEVAFSTFRNIYINENNIDPHDIDIIISHEQEHINQYHSIDKWMINILQILFWYQPIMQYFNRCINENHEWIVDACMSKKMNVQIYQLKLLQYQQYNKHIDLASQFAISNLKKRILIMNQNTSSKWKISLFASSIFCVIGASTAIAYQNVTTIVWKESINNAAHIAPDSVISKQQKKSISQNTAGKQNPLIIVDGKQIDYLLFVEKIQQQEIASKNVLSTTEGQEKYGEKGVNGVIEITLKKQELKRQPEGFTKVTTPNQISYDTVAVIDPISGEEHFEVIAHNNVNSVDATSDKVDNNGITILIDGKQSNRGIEKINPEHIESMDVIKDKNTISIIIKKEFKHLYKNSNQ